jgi:citrate synthase
MGATEVAVALGASAESDAPIHSRLASSWTKNRRTADLIRRALVLHADQELNSSTFAARVAASTGESLAACVLFGFATLSGPLHGDTTLRIRSLMEDVARTDARTVIAAHLASGMAYGALDTPSIPKATHERRHFSRRSIRRAIRAHDGDGENRDRTASQSRLCAARNVATMRASAGRAVLIVRAWTLRRFQRFRLRR